MQKYTCIAVFIFGVMIFLHTPNVFSGTLPDDADRLIHKTQSEINPLFDKLIVDLEGMQTKLTQAGDLENAIAIRDKIKSLKVSYQALFLSVLSDPGDLTGFTTAAVGDVLYFQVIGQTQGSTVWGTDMYTTDSRLAMAAVHAGAVKPNEQGLVKVTFAPGQASYQGTTRNGITTSNWGSYQISYTIEAVQ